MLSQQSAKEEILSVVNALPDNITWEDAVYSLYVRQKVNVGLQAMHEGREISHEKMLSKYVANENNVD